MRTTTTGTATTTATRTTTTATATTQGLLAILPKFPLEDLRSGRKDGANASFSHVLVAAAVSSPLRHLAGLEGSLRDAADPQQQGVAAAAVLLGGLTAARGPALWPWLFLAAVSIVTAAIASSDVLSGSLAPDLASKLLLVVPVTVVVALSVLLSFEASQRLLGFALGSVVAWWLQEWVVAVTHPIHYLVLVWYVAASLGGLVALSCVWRHDLLATLAPLVGGLLASSGAGVIAAYAASVYGGEGVRLACLPQPGEPWLSAAGALLGRPGLRTLAAQGSCALLAAVLHGLGAGRAAALCCLAAAVLAGAPLASTGLPCRVLHECPDWLRQDEPSLWPLVGGLLWAALACASAWRQLGALPWNGSSELSASAAEKDDVAYESLSQSEDPSYSLSALARMDAQRLERSR